jgi:predicted HTH transcriptional regulator
MSRSALPSKISEGLDVDPQKIRWLTRLLQQGEGLNIEFKAKTNFPDKIVHELIAFANTSGGTLLVGISDDGKISGVKYPEEDQMLIMNALRKHCWPRIKIKSDIMKVSEKKWVVAFEVPESRRKPIRFKQTRTKQITYIRYRDKTLQASPEAIEILRLKHGIKAVTFTYGDIETKILKLLRDKKQATLPELKIWTSISESVLSNKLVHLAAANVIGWKPQEPNDLYLSKA